MSIMEIYPPLSPREIEGARIAKDAAKEGMVLLKNEGQVLPISPKAIALFGNGAMRTVRGGSGSGDPFNGGLLGGGDTDVDQSPRYHIQILPAMQSMGFTIVNEGQLRKYAKLYDEAKSQMTNTVMQSFMFPEETLEEAALTEVAASTDTAVVILSRHAGEGHDRHLEDDYCLSDVEKHNYKLIRKLFDKFILVLNVGGPIAAADLMEADPDAILLMGQAGQEGGLAVTEVLMGETNPSGKLTATWALDYADYPSADGYLSDPDTSLYTEGIYVGYRYFDTEKKAVGYPFGYGLSYTDFSIDATGIAVKGDALRITVKVTNTGNYAGKEVVQAYISAPSTELDMPYQELRGFEKTDLIEPGGSQAMVIVIPLSSLASYSEGHGGYIISRGNYIIRIGNSGTCTKAVGALHAAETQTVILVDQVMPLVQELSEKKGLQGLDLSAEAAGLPCIELPSLKQEDRRSRIASEEVTSYVTDPSYQAVMPYEKVLLKEAGSRTYQQVKAGEITIEDFLAQLTDEEMALLACGSGWGIADDANPIIGANSESVPGAAGETTHILEKYGVPSIVLADGPGGVRITQHFEATNVDTGLKQEVYHYCIAWPVGTLIAQSFDRALAKRVGLGMKADLLAMKIDVLLGPGCNIQRNPLCGRNFEYFSEDPLLSGEMAAAITLGIQDENKAAACIKHYAANNQETNRHANDSVVGQRALREIYLEPYRIAIEKARPMTIMTSYNKINSVPSADSYDLCSNVCRGEWGFEGFIMTDWNGGMSTPFISMHAGNDLIMPGGMMKSANILNAVKRVEPVFDEKGEVEKIRLVPFAPLYALSWNCFAVKEDGEAQVRAELGTDYTAVIADDGRILVNGEEIYLEAGSMREAMHQGTAFKPLRNPVTTAIASVEDGGKAIVYRGSDVFEQKICRGDLQLRAKCILQVMLKLGR